MVDYELFKTVVTQRIGDYLPEEFRNTHPKIQRVNKVNGAKDAFCMEPDDPDDQKAIPTLYLDDIYVDFAVDEDLNRVLSEVAYVFMTCSGRYIPDELKGDIRDLTDGIIFQLVNAELNEELLKELPHRRWLDLAVIYRVVFRRNEDGIDSFLLSYEHLEDIGISEEDLYELAMENTVRMFPVDRIDGGDSMFILTNDVAWGGASTILYPGEMNRLAEKIGGDYFLLPSSVHEFFVIPAKRTNPEKLVSMLRVGNGIAVRMEEVLSNSIYRFDEKKGKLELVAS